MLSLIGFGDEVVFGDGVIGLGLSDGILEEGGLEGTTKSLRPLITFLGWIDWGLGERVGIRGFVGLSWLGFNWVGGFGIWRGGLVVEGWVAGFASGVCVEAEGRGVAICPYPDWWDLKLCSMNNLL